MTRTITDKAVLLGFSPQLACVYSEIVELDEYWDGEHVWDNSRQVVKLQLEKLRGYLFNDVGELIQEFESTFDLSTGVFVKGWTRHADGTFQEHTG